MNVKTRKYALEPKTYRGLAMNKVLTEMWWAFLIPIALASLTFVFNEPWYAISAAIITVLYLLFWYIQFTGISQLEQYKMLFERMNYEINSQQILMKINSKQGMPVKWEQIKKVKIGKDYFLFSLNRAHLVHLPFKIFSNQNDIKFVESILKRKGFLAQ